MACRRCVSCCSSLTTSRTRITNRLPARAPRGSLRAWACASSTSNSEVRSPLSAIPLGTVNHCTATARRSFRPAKPTSNGLQPAAIANCRATHSVFALRLRTFSRAWMPAPDGAKPSCSSTTKSSGSTRSRPLASGSP